MLTYTSTHKFMHGKMLSVSLLGLLCVACSIDVSSPSPVSTAINQQDDPLPADRPKIVSPHQWLRDSSEWRIKAWKEFVANGQYRLAQEEDFSFSEQAKSEPRDQKGRDWWAYSNVLMVDDVDRQGGNGDLVAIVVDNTLDSHNRYGIVIFPEPANKTIIPKPKWLFKEKDLSNATLSLASRVYVIDYKRTREGCFIKWSEKRKQFYCN